MSTLKLFSQFILIVFCSSACGLKIKNQGVSNVVPTFLQSKIWLAGTSSEGTTPLEIKSYKFAIDNCSNAENNRYIVVDNPQKDHLENLVSGSEGCVFSLGEFSIGGSMQDIYIPENGLSKAAKKGSSSTYIGVTTKGRMTVVAEDTPASPLSHKESLEFSLLPALSERVLTGNFTEFDLKGTGPLPKINVTEVTIENPNTQGSSKGINIFVECPSIREFDLCEDQKFLDMSFAYMENPTENPSEETIETVFGTSSATIVPNLSHIHRNGVKFYIVLKAAEPEKMADKIGFFIKYGDSLKYFTIDLSL